MASVSIIGTGNMGQAIAALVTKGGNTADLIAIDTHTHLEVSCRNPFDSYG